MKHMLAAAICLGLAAGPAHATATADCVAQDTNIEFRFYALANRSAMGALFNVDAEAKVLVAGIPDQLRSLPVKDNFRDSWITGRQFNLLFHAAAPDDVTDPEWTLLIETTGVGDDLSFEGTYELTLPRKPADGDDYVPPLTGKIACSNG